MSKGENIELFSDINSYEEYSTYSKDLNKLHGNNSFKNFFSNLNTRKPISLTNLEFTQIESKQGRYKKDQPFNNDLFEKMLRTTKNDNSNSNISIKHIHQYSTQASYRTIENIKRKKRLRLFQLKNMTSFGKYYPNYNSVNAKVPSVDFSKELPRPGFEHSLDKGLSDHKLISPKMKRDSKGKSLPFPLVKHNSIDNLPHTINTNIKISERDPIISALKKNNNNHALKFSQYIWRKNYSPQHNNNNSCDSRETISISPKKNIKMAVEFNKMLTNHNIFSYRPVNGPSIGIYNPKYDAVFKKSPDVLFGNQKNKAKFNKKFLLKKLWSSYKVTHEYQLVNFKT